MTCMERSGFLFAHGCDRPASLGCGICGKTISTATKKVARGKSRNEAKMPRLKRIAHKPGSIHSAPCKCSQKTAVNSPPATRHGKNWPTARPVSESR